MSIRFIPAPARGQTYFDDSIVPLTAKTIDHEDYRPLPWLTPPISVQTLYQDEPFKLITFAGDDEPFFAWPIPAPKLGLFWQNPDGDELPNAANFPGDESIGVSTIASADRIPQLPFVDEDVLPVTTGFTPLFRKTLSSIGGRIGQRQLQG